MDLSDNILWSSSLYLNESNNKDSSSINGNQELVIENLVPIFNTLNLNSTPVPVKGGETTFTVETTYLDAFKDEIGLDNDDKYNV